MKVGDIVRVRTPTPGEPWHIYRREAFTKECKPGDLGTVVDILTGAYRVRWHELGRRTPTSRINASCLINVKEEEELDRQARSLLLGEAEEYVPEVQQQHHCPTCACKD